MIYLASLQDVPASLYEAADLDGMGPVTKFLNVTVPMISPVILFNVIMAIITAWQVFAVPFIMLGLPYPGSTHEAIERDITRPVEEVLATLSGIKYLE